jgi:hypothetical protein
LFYIDVTNYSKVFLDREINGRAIFDCTDWLMTNFSLGFIYLAQIYYAGAVVAPYLAPKRNIYKLVAFSVLCVMDI